MLIKIGCYSSLLGVFLFKFNVHPNLNKKENERLYKNPHKNKEINALQ